MTTNSLIFLDKVRKTVKKYKLLKAGENTIVGVSGGVDSISLLHSLFLLKQELKLRLIVAHLNHMIRGKQADQEALFVEREAESLNLPCEIKKINVPEYRNKKKISLQMAAREARYNFFASLSRKYSGAKIALAHTKDDQAETILMHLLRGSGVTGLAGIPPIREERIIRPLIQISRAEISEFARAQGLNFINDPSNLDLHYQRNKIRAELLPLLKKDYNPRILNILSNTGEILRQEDDFLNDYAHKLLKKIIFKTLSDEIQLDLFLLRKYHLALQRRILRCALKKLRGNLQRISLRQISLLLRFISRGEINKSLDLPDQILALYTNNYLILKKNNKQNNKNKIPLDCSLNIPGFTFLEARFKLQTKVKSRKETKLDFTNRNKVFLDFGKTGDSLKVRYRRPGDYFHPFGLQGTKKLKKYFIDQKVPRAKRDHIPLILKEDEIIWIIGERISEKYKVEKKTERILSIENL